MAQPDVGAVAEEVLAALDSCRQITPFTSRNVGFNLECAYAVAAELRRLRLRRGEVPSGRKIGFTNRSAWVELGITKPIWGDMYTTTVQEHFPVRFKLPRQPELRIEPEIIFKLARPVSAGLGNQEL